MENTYGKEFLQVLYDSCKEQSSEVGIVDLASINNSAAFALGAWRKTSRHA